LHRQIERNLHSTTKTPRLHREELRRFVHLPNLIQLQFDSEIGRQTSTALEVLQNIMEKIDILQDPVVVQLMADPTTKANLEKVLRSGRTRNQDALHRFCAKADHVATQLGAWAADLFISLATAKLKQAVTARRDIMFGWDDEDQDYLHSVLRMVCDDQAVSSKMAGNVLNMSGKVRELLRFLGTLRNCTFSGIIFVEQRAIAVLLCKILSVHTDTRHLSCATFVGTSNNFKRRATIGDLTDAALQDQILDAFRIGACNFIIATSVLEEGIDISSCNLVICFDRPSNLKSFIQRRGRARDQKSNFVMMMSENDVLTKKTNWQALEEEMIMVYQEERRILDTVLELEDSTENSNRRYEIPSTQ
jgi:Lhr-like helicase